MFIQLITSRRHVGPYGCDDRTDNGKGDTVSIPLMLSDYCVEFKCLQYPVKLCFDVSINKARSQSLRVAGTD